MSFSPWGVIHTYTHKERKRKGETDLFAHGWTVRYHLSGRECVIAVAAAATICCSCLA